MDKAIAEIAKAIKESEQGLGVCLQQMFDVLQTHEERLQKLEGSKFDLEEELDFLQARLERLGDSAKRVEGLSLLTEIREILGVKDELEDMEEGEQ